MKRRLVYGLGLALVLASTVDCGSAPADEESAGPQGAGAICGDGRVDATGGETCDTAIASGAGACPTSCPSTGDACRPSLLVNPGTCTAACAAAPITTCRSGDGCCPAGCTAANDGDCRGGGGSCGNGTVETTAGETCDVAIPAGPGACPTSCPTSGNACAPNVVLNAGTCTAACAPQPITTCRSGDGCCPAGCTAANDADCGQAATADLTGTWVTFTSAKATFKTTPPPLSLVAPVNDTNVTVDTWVRSYTSPAGEMRINICRLEVNGALVRMSYPPAVIRTMQATVRAGGALQVPVGSSTVIPTYTILSGVDAAGNSIDAAPPPFPGGDADGHPGVTIPTQLNLVLAWSPVFNAYSGIVITTSTSGVTVTSPTAKAGRTLVTTHGVTFGSDNLTLSPAGTTFDLTFNDGSIPFTSAKVANDDSATYSCEYIAQHYP